jgi:hypothetical protein
MKIAESPQFYGHKAIVFQGSCSLNPYVDVFSRYHLYYKSEFDFFQPFDLSNFVVGMQFKVH